MDDRLLKPLDNAPPWSSFLVQYLQGDERPMILPSTQRLLPRRLSAEGASSEVEAIRRAALGQAWLEEGVQSLGFCELSWLCAGGGGYGLPWRTSAGYGKLESSVLKVTLLPGKY